VRDAGWEKIIGDERLQKDMSAAPFDGKRPIDGGFETIVEA
jgi:uncharacterized protein YbaA (DUF1428 family)